MKRSIVLLIILLLSLSLTGNVFGFGKKGRNPLQQMNARRQASQQPTTKQAIPENHIVVIPKGAINPPTKAPIWFVNPANGDLIDIANHNTFATDAKIPYRTEFSMLPSTEKPDYVFVFVPTPPLPTSTTLIPTQGLNNGSEKILIYVFPLGGQNFTYPQQVNPTTNNLTFLPPVLENPLVFMYDPNLDGVNNGSDASVADYDRSITSGEPSFVAVENKGIFHYVPTSVPFGNSWAEGQPFDYTQFKKEALLSLEIDGLVLSAVLLAPETGGLSIRAALPRLATACMGFIAFGQAAADTTDNSR